MKILFGFIVLSFLLFTSCTTMMTEVDCRAGAWEKAGYDDGLRGYSYIESHKKDCSQYGVTVDEELYRKGYRRGYDEGKKRYCTYKNGYEMGLNDSSYYDSCPSDLEPEFYKGYTAGKLQRSIDEQNRRQSQ